MVDTDTLVHFVCERNYSDSLNPPYRIDSRPNPWLQKPNAEHYETDCGLHPQSECVVIRLHDVYYTERYAALVAESACGHLSVWAD